MAKSMPQEPNCSLTKDRTLKLETKAGHTPVYSGVIVHDDTLLVIDRDARNLQLYSLRDNKLLSTSHRLASIPMSVCLISKTEVAVYLWSSAIVIFPLKFIDDVNLVKTLNVTTGFNSCNSVAKLNSNQLVVSGWKHDDRTLYCCVVNLIDGSVESTYKICKGGFWNFNSRTHLAIKDNTVYISCCMEDSNLAGVYAYILKPHTRKFLYRHHGWKPYSIIADGHFIFVSDLNTNRIHQLTNSGQLVTIHKVSSMPFEIFYDDQNGALYSTSWMSDVITVYKLQYLSDSTIPPEILKMNTRSIQKYKQALNDGMEKVYNSRIMVVGNYGVGKTTLTQRLLGKNVNITDRHDTNGIDVHVECCKISLTTGEWTTQDKNAEQYSRLQRLVNILNEHAQKQATKTGQERQSQLDVQFTSEEDDNGLTEFDQTLSPEPDTNQNVHPLPPQPVKSNVFSVCPDAGSGINSQKNEKDILMKIVQLVNTNSGKLEKGMVEYAAFSLWDFAGQYVFYTTHQTFLTSRAIYLLVIDLSQQVTDLIKDDEFFRDMEGIKLCKVDEMLKDKPSLLHLMDNIAIDNTQSDPRLEDLKRRIFELASQQPHWGQEKPARWLPLEQAIMTLKASGVKVAPLSLIEEIKRLGSVRIDDRDELEVFLNFQHEIGTILYFSVDGLMEKIVLDPQWMIDALKSLITVEMFITKNPAITSMWYIFKNEGKLTHELIDAIWTKETNPDFHANKEHILLLLEKFNIIATPRSYSEDGKEVKVEDYFLSPCMLHQKTPKDVISLEPNTDMETSSVLCYVFTDNFLPSPLFHRLLAACLAHWPIAKRKGENQIFCGSCVFKLDPCHKLILYFRDYAIFVRVAKMSKKNKTPDLELCIHVREFIESNLSKIIGYLCQNLKFELYIQCMTSEADCLDSIFPVSELQNNEEFICSSHDTVHVVESQDLLKFWFERKNDECKQTKGTKRKASSLSEEDGDQNSATPNNPITKENINHFRLYNALTTVCADALRKILLTQVPAPHANIYQALLANISILTTRRQIRPGQALLNQDQIHMAFPDPMGRYTGTVEQFDITLLYTLIRNVSNVSPPTTGWGSPPTDKPRDTTLGASVERIRSYRNCICGHSVDGKIDQQEFEDYWKQLDCVLGDIENIIGNHDYRNELEKRRTQIITPNEACEKINE